MSTKTQASSTATPTTTVDGNIYNVVVLIRLAKDLPVEHVDIAQFTAQKYPKCWTDNNERWLGPWDILKLAQKYHNYWSAIVFANLDWAAHTYRVRDAQYQEYPILIIGASRVIDGMHRLTKAWIDGATTVPVKRFAVMPQEAFLRKKS